jgi:D-lactate dehydrogenase
MNIIVFEAEPWEQEGFKQFEAKQTVALSDKPLTLENVDRYPDAEVISTFIYSNLTAEVLSKLPQLKLIATRSTGYDHIDMEYCEGHGITVCNVPEYGDNTVAEHVFALLLGISRNLVESVERTRRGDFSLKGLRGFDLKGKTFGVIGTGSIGQCVIHMAHGFGMNVLAYDVQQDPSLAEKLDFEYRSMDGLLSEVDILSLHVPANEHTYHLISDAEFDKMKDGVVIINTSRGSVLHVEALARALAVGKVAAAGLDVLPDEPTIREESELLHSFYRETHNLQTLLADSVLMRLRNVIITPHSAFYTKEAINRILETTVENIAAFIQNEPQNVIN